MKIVSFIPARGGSKGIPDKNITPVNGKPLIAYTIFASLESVVNETWVSTDSEIIKHVSEKCGAKVIDRPSHLSGDCAPTEWAIEHFLENVDCDIIVFLQATSPMTQPEDINNGIRKLIGGEYDSLFSAVKSNDILVWTDKMKPVNYDPFNRGNRQSRNESIYIETGGFYIFRRELFERKKCRLGGKIGTVEIPFWRSFEIDDYDDITNIDKLMKD